MIPYVLFDRSTGEQVAKLLLDPLLVRGTVLHLLPGDADSLPKVNKPAVWRVVSEPEIAIAAGYRPSVVKLLVEQIGTFTPPNHREVFDWLMKFSEVAPPERKDPAA